jgi:hypothetical protein
MSRSPSLEVGGVLAVLSLLALPCSACGREAPAHDVRDGGGDVDRGADGVDAGPCEPTGDSRFCVRSCGEDAWTSAECSQYGWTCAAGWVRVSDCPPGLCWGHPRPCCDPLTGRSGYSGCEDGRWTCPDTLLDYPCDYLALDSLDGLWEERAWVSCDPGIVEVAPEGPAIELLSLFEGAFEVRWADPVSTWYSGTYTYAPRTGEVVLEVLDGEQIPDDVALSGRALPLTLSSSQVAFFGVWFGTVSDERPPRLPCGHSFVAAE